MKIVLVALVIILMMVLFLRLTHTKHNNPRVNQRIVCNNMENYATGRKNKFVIRQKDYAFYVVDGCIVGFKKLGKRKSKIVYYKESE